MGLSSSGLFSLGFHEALSSIQIQIYGTVFERVWLDGGKKNYVVGDKISVADILAVCELEQPSL